MNNDILNRILSDNEELDRFLNWLSSQKNEVGDDGCTKIDFVIFFLSYLRSQTASFFEQKRTKTKSDWKRVTPVTDKPATNVKPLSSGDTVRRLFSPENGNNGILVSPIKQRLNNADNHQNNRVTPKKLFNPQTGIYDHNYPPIHQFNTANLSMNQSNTTNLSMNQSNTTNLSMSQLHSNSPIHQSNTANSSMNQPTTTNLSMNQSTTTNLSMNQSTTTNLSMNQSNPSTLSMSQLHSYAPIQPSSTANPSMNQIPIHQSNTANLSMNFAVGSSNFQMNPISVLPTQIQGGVMMQGGGRMMSPNIQIDPRSLQGVALVMSPSKQAGPWNNMQGGCRVMAPTILVDPRSNNVHVVGQVMSPINQAGPWGNVGPVMSSPIKADPKSNLVVGQVTTSNQAGPWGNVGPVMSSPIKTDPKSNLVVGQVTTGNQAGPWGNVGPEMSSPIKADPKSNLVVGQVTTGNQAGPWGKVGSVMSPATPSDPKSNLVGQVTSPNNQAGPWGNTGSPIPKIDLQDTTKVIISNQAGPWGNVMNPSTTSDPKSNLVVGQVSSPSNKTGPWCNIGSPPTASDTKISLQNAAQVTSPTHQTSGPWNVVTPPNQTKNSNTQGVSQMTYHTPQRTNFSHRANSLLFSPNSSSSSAGVLSPDSPSQQRDWRKSEGGRRGGGGGGGAPTLKNICIGDFIVAGSVGKKQDKARKRIKPTRLAMAGDSQTNDVSSVSKSSSNVFTAVPESPSADTNQSNNASNFDEERQLLKQYNKQKESRDKSPMKNKKETTNSNEETVNKIEVKKKKEMIDKGEELEEEGKEENKSEEVPKEETKKENISEKKRKVGKEKDRSREKPKEEGKKENGSEEKPKVEGKKGNWSKEKPKEGDKEEDRSEEKPKEEEKKKNRSEEKPEEGKGEEKFEDRSEKGSESKSKEVDKEKCDDKNRIEKRSASICKSSSKEVKPKEGKEECNDKDKVREEIASKKENTRSDSKNRGKEEIVNAKSDGKNKAKEEEIEKGEMKITVPNDPKYIRADPSKVTNAPMLRKLAKIYCVLLDCNLVFNVTAEIHFLVSLLAVKVADRRTDKPEEKAKCDGKSSVVGGNVECDGKSAGTEQNFKCDEKSVTVKDVKCDGKSVTVKDVECDKKSVTEKDVECDEHSVTEQNIDLVIQEKLVGVEKLETSLSSPSPPPPSSTSYPPPPASDTNKEEENVDELLSSVHNSVYFAYYVLERQMKYLQLLDRRTLKFLAESKKIAQFQRSFRNKLLKLCSAQPSKTTTNPPATCATDPESGICPVQFHVETDNRWTFTCDSSFATYRKQRDELYAILQAWARGQQGGEGGGGFGKLKTRVERLLAMSQDPINVRHLAKHFCDLLLRAVATSEETTIEELENLPEVNKSKLSLLTKRLTEPSSEKVSSPRPETNFPGFQQFYHDFLVIASQNFLFNVHLINCFVNEITVRSSATYDIDESEGEGQVVQEETRQMFVQGLSSLCVLAKFLGLVVFAPYRSSFEISKSVLQEEINIRKQLDPPLKLDAHLDRASRTGSLVYTVPWVVEYLGMMDAVACHLPCYQQVLVTLFNIYRLCSPRLESADNADKREVEREGSRETEGSVEREGLKETLGKGDEEKLMKLKEGGAMEKIGIVETVKDVDKEKVIILKERGKLEKEESNHNQENESESFKDSKELVDKDSKEKNSGSKDGNQELKLVEEDGIQGNSELKNGIVGLKDSIKGGNNVLEVKKSVLEDVALDECLTDDEKCDRKQDKSVSKDVSSVSVDSKSVSIDGSSVSNDVNSVSKDVSLVSKDVNSVLKDVNSVSRDANSVSRDASSVSNDVNSVSKDASSVSNDVNSVSNEKSSASKAVNSVSRDASPVSKDVNSVSKDVNSVSKDVNSVSIATKPFSYDTKPNSKDTLDNELFLNARTENESVSKEVTDSSKFLCEAELLKRMLLFDDTRDRVQPAEMAPLVGALLRLCLGWLFGSAILTQELMGQVVMRSDVERFLAETFQTTRNKLTMDSCSDLVTHEIIHKFCPYLKSFHALLTKKTTQIAVASVKHVTPISSVSTLIQTATNNTTAVPPEIAIQLQLEDHFFMGQSESVKRTVEFVAERIASACIKEVIGTVVVDLKKKVADTLQHQSAQSKKTGTTVDLKPLVAEYRRRVTEQLSQVEQSRLGVALRALLGPDICRQSLELCQLITARKFQERVVNWLQAHINIQEILTKVITTYEKEHKSNSNNDEDDALEDFFKADKLEPTKIGEEDSSSKTFNVDEVTVCSRTLIHIQDIASDALESFGKQGIKSATEALELVSDVEKSLKMCPCQPIKKQICIALLDYVILMISFQPDQVSDEMLAQLSRLLYNGGHLEVEHLWSQRNVMLLIQGGAGDGGSSRSTSNTSAAWRRFSQLTVALVEARCMDVASLEQQVVALFRCAWPDNVLKTISEGIRCTVNDLKKKTRCDPEFLDLLSDIAVDISDDIEFD